MDAIWKGPIKAVPRSVLHRPGHVGAYAESACDAAKQTLTHTSFVANQIWLWARRKYE
jgi:hypothetical protein